MTDLVVATSAASSPPGGLILEELLGSGSFADVWKGRDALRPVAIKLCRPANALVSSALDHAKALARVDHPNISRVYYVDEVTDPTTGERLDCVVMELIEDGKTLESALDEPPMALERAALVGRAILAGLQHIHECELVHGDLHAENVLLTKDSAKIIDILYRGTLAIASTASRDQKYRFDLQNLALLLRQLLERANVPEALIGGFSGEALRPRTDAKAMGRLFETAIENARSAASGPAGVAPATPMVPAPTMLVRARGALDNNNVGEMRRAVRQARRELPPALLTWRSTTGRENLASASIWRAKIDEAVHFVGNPMTLVLAAAEANGPVIEIARQFIDDLWHPPGWERAGLEKVTDTPRALIYFLHHVTGAYLLEIGDRKAALDLLRTRIKEGDYPSGPLGENHGLMGWPNALMADDSGAFGAWRWLRSGHRFPWVAEFFVNPVAFQSALSAYATLASLNELATHLGKGTMERVSPRDVAVPPIFVVDMEDGLHDPLRGLSAAVPDKAALELLASCAGTTADRIRTAWPKWYAGWVEWLGSNGRFGRYFIARNGNEVPKLP